MEGAIDPRPMEDRGKGGARGRGADLKELRHELLPDSFAHESSYSVHHSGVRLMNFLYQLTLARQSERYGCSRAVNLSVAENGTICLDQSF
jgi:hypothetical protein